VLAGALVLLERTGPGNGQGFTLSPEKRRKDGARGI